MSVYPAPYSDNTYYRSNHFYQNYAGDIILLALMLPPALKLDKSIPN